MISPLSFLRRTAVTSLIALGGVAVAVAAEGRLAEVLSSRDGAYAPGIASELHARGGLPNAFGKMERGEAVTVAYFGTSVTDAPGWRVLSFEWLQRQCW